MDSLQETDKGLTTLRPTARADLASSRSAGWFAYAWDKDGRAIYGLRPTDDEHHFMLVWLNAETGAQRIINQNLGTIQQAFQPIRGFSRLKTGGFVTSLPHVRSDIYLIEGLRLPQKWWERLWRPGGSEPR